MKRKIVALLILSMVFVGCSKTETKEKVGATKETFSDVYYDSFPEISNLINYLHLPPEDVKNLSQSDDKLVFSFYYDDKYDTDDITALSYENYVKQLMKDGYTMELVDGNISSTFELKKDGYTIKITSIVDKHLEEWKESFQEEGIDIGKMDKENTLVKIYNEK